MTEQDAINALLGEFESEANEMGKEEQETQVQQENTGEQEPTQTAMPNLSKDDISEAMLNAMQKMKSTEQEQALNAQAQAQSEAKNASQREILEQMGLGELAGMSEQLKAMQEQMAQQAEEARRQNVFNQNITQFEKEFPTINPKEFGEFAKANGFDGYLGEDYNMWRLVANTMLQIATPKQRTDEIIGNGGGKNEISAFERLKNGEDVSDIEIGAELLKSL
ncbi:HIT family hydrolase [Campylobacter sp. faydin G-140]|uniref:HIT family hydrolase n=1 Tax=Campylobacter anatolicus TaxID=2829105 RepID=UPI001B960F09|nr:HIT family hydrolase [Campylobacter anatolicus]MBR8466184.1 HIT family hydrolase [Campylobacter anatolicus]